MCSDQPMKPSTPSFHPNDLKADIPELEPGEAYRSLLAAKDRVREALERDLDAGELLFHFRDKLARSYRNQLHWTLYYLLLIELVRDDGGISREGAGALDTILAEVTGGACLRCDYDPARVILHDGTVPYERFIAAVKNLHEAHRAYGEFLAAAGREAPVSIVSGESPRLAPFGRVLDLPDRQIRQDLRNSLFAYQDGVESKIQMFDRRVEFGRIVRRQGDFVVTALDWHENTSEVLVPDMPVLVVMTDRASLAHDHFHGCLAVIKPGQLVLVNQGIVHMAPFMLVPGVYTSPVIFRLGTTHRPADWDEARQGAWAPDLHKHTFTHGYRFLPAGFMAKTC